MSNIAIQVRDLSKKYRIGMQVRRYKTLRESVTGVINRPLRYMRTAILRSQESGWTEQNIVWALRNVTFDIFKGDVVGIIGRNGAGKSTLLKILSRITEPTGGTVDVYGRVGSLLEVGTGFHPELTGRENIFLNGAILGMTRKEIERKFDEIVEFAEISQFLDTPVKHYSSGMYLRLAFSVAAHLEPEILIVDEVLAVGDAQFQKKCLGKIGDVAHEGRTVLFVSHNMEAIASLCNRGILLKSGLMMYQGEIREVIAQYIGKIHEGVISLDNSSRRYGSGGIRFQDVWFETAHNNRVADIPPDEPVCLYLDASVSEAYQHTDKLVISFGVDTLEGYRLFTAVSSWVNKEVKTNGPFLRAQFILPSLPLVPGQYLISVSVAYNTETLDYVEHCASIEILPSTESFAQGRNRSLGYLNIPYDFSMPGI